MRIDHSRLRRPGIAAATVALIVAGVIGGVGVAGAQQKTITIYAVENGARPCFSETVKQTCVNDEQPTVRITTGDKIIWNFGTGIHNAASNGSTPENTAWKNRTSALVPAPAPNQEWEFGQQGTYKFVCQAHTPWMAGTIIVEGPPVATATQTPTPSASASASPTATATFAATVPPTATAVQDNHLTTPAPGKGKAAKDTDAPRVLRARVKSASGGAKLSFWVSEPANVEVTVRRGKSVVTSARLHVAAGTRSVALRSSSLRKQGTYAVEWYAVDAMANQGNVVKETLKVKG